MNNWSWWLILFLSFITTINSNWSISKTRLKYYCILFERQTMYDFQFHHYDMTVTRLVRELNASSNSTDRMVSLHAGVQCNRSSAYLLIIRIAPSVFTFIINNTNYFFIIKNPNYSYYYATWQLLCIDFSARGIRTVMHLSLTMQSASI